MSLPVQSDYLQDGVVFPVLEGLLECFKQQLAGIGITRWCKMAVIPGGLPALDYCGSDDCGEGCADNGIGEGWVRLAGMFPSQQFPNPDASTSCAVSRYAIEVEIGYSLCAPMPDNDGTPPSDEEDRAASAKQSALMMAARRALICCAGDEDRDVQIGQFTPLPVQGGCVAATWSGFIEVFL